jgi:hypothetical protein
MKSLPLLLVRFDRFLTVKFSFSLCSLVLFFFIKMICIYLDSVNLFLKRHLIFFWALAFLYFKPEKEQYTHKIPRSLFSMLQQETINGSLHTLIDTTPNKRQQLRSYIVEQYYTSSTSNNSSSNNNHHHHARRQQRYLFKSFKEQGGAYQEEL